MVFIYKQTIKSSLNRKDFEAEYQGNLTNVITEVRSFKSGYSLDKYSQKFNKY